MVLKISASSMAKVLSFTIMNTICFGANMKVGNSNESCLGVSSRALSVSTKRLCRVPSASTRHRATTANMNQYSTQLLFFFLQHYVHGDLTARDLPITFGGRVQWYYIVQELCESRGGRPGLSVLTSLLVSVDIKIY